MKSEDLLDEYRARLERLREVLEAPDEVSTDERSRIRDDIVGLFREVETTVAELEVIKEGVRPLVDRYKRRFQQPSGPPAKLRIDHLGSSTYRERGWSALAGADYERAVRELEKALEYDPENLDNLTLLAWAYLRTHAWDEARTLLENVLERDPEHPLARANMGYLRLREQRFAEAIENLASVARDGTDRTATLYANLYLGIVYAERDMHRDAQAFFEKTLELGPNLIEAYWELGRSHQREGRDDLALIAWKKGAENRYNPWGERCRLAAERLEAEQASRGG